MVHRVRAVLVGSIAALGDKGVVSGIAKRPVRGSRGRGRDGCGF